MSLNSSELPRITGGSWLQKVTDSEILFLSTDSRNAVKNPSCLFFAIKGNIHDGHDYIAELYNKNLRNFIIEDKFFDTGPFPGANFLLSGNSIDSLQKITAQHRSKFSLEVIGITGSNGKTIVKEWLSQFISRKQNVIKTPKSYNSQIGVPLSVWLIRDHHEKAIIEAGISKPGEMINLEKIIKPETGIFTNIGPAHDEGFHSWDKKIREKLILFKDAKSLIFNSDQEQVKKSVDQYLPEIDKISWGYDSQARYMIRQSLTKGGESLLEIRNNNESSNFILPFIDKASIENLTHCIVYLLSKNWKQKDIQDVLEDISNISMRLVLKKGTNDCYIVDDSYSNDLSGLEMALSYLDNQNQRKKKSIILTDILQSGLSDDEINHKTAELLKNHSLEKIIVIGEQIKKLQSYLNHPSFYHFPDTGQFLDQFRSNNFQNELILIKGARKFNLEKVVNHLQEKIHGTVLEINLDAITHNLNTYRSYVNPQTRIMVMVKALAYGSGSIEVANLLQFHRIDYLGVAYTDEAITLRKNGISLPVMIMNPTIEAMEKIADYRLEPEIYNPGLLEKVDQWTRDHNEKLKIHVKFDTGMHRLGFRKEDLNILLKTLQSNPNLILTSVFSHLAAADESEHDYYTRKQAEDFDNIIRTIRKNIDRDFMAHLCNSAAIIRFPEYQHDMVRLGIGLYGTDSTGSISDELLPIGTLKTTISHIMSLETSDSVGYGRKGRLNRNSRIATIAIGYADGFSRAFSNGIGKVYVNGQMAPVVGNVCMDMTMIDVTGLQASEGDEVIIFGEKLPLIELANAINTIPYEILTGVSERVKRVYISQ